MIIRPELHDFPHGLELIGDKQQNAAEKESKRIVLPLPCKRHQTVLGVLLIDVVDPPDHGHDAEHIEGLVKDGCMNNDFHDANSKNGAAAACCAEAEAVLFQAGPVRTEADALFGQKVIGDLLQIIIALQLCVVDAVLAVNNEAGNAVSAGSVKVGVVV